MNNAQKYFETYGIYPDITQCPPIYNEKVCPDISCSECRTWWVEDYEAPTPLTPLTVVIQEVAEDICNNFCKYTETIDDNCECEYMRKNGYCPLERLV